MIFFSIFDQCLSFYYLSLNTPELNAQNNGDARRELRFLLRHVHGDGESASNFHDADDDDGNDADSDDEDSDARSDADNGARSGEDDDDDGTGGGIHRDVDGVRSGVQILKLNYFNRYEEHSIHKYHLRASSRLRVIRCLSRGCFSVRLSSSVSASKIDRPRDREDSAKYTQNTKHTTATAILWISIMHNLTLWPMDKKWKTAKEDVILIN